MVKLFGNGDIIYGMRFTTTLSCMMDLHNYPLDSQNCTIEIESYGYTKSELNIDWIKSIKSVTGIENVQLPQFKIADYKTSSYLEIVATGKFLRDIF
jgi:gamma-aminobutyric acid receptor subunit beta